MMFSDLPRELESEILVRVPATSLVRLQTTCKRWYDLFKDSEFVEKNLVNGKSETKVMLKQYCMDFSIGINFHGVHNRFGPYIEFTHKLKSLSLKDSEHGLKSDSKHLDIFEIFHCNGLLLCTTRCQRFAIWNPCTGQIRWIKTKPARFNRWCIKYFLGYQKNNKSCHSYKILTCNLYDKGLAPDFEIYEFDTDSWRVLDDITRDWRIELNSVTLKGNAYCFATNIEGPFVRFILKFDFTTERFGRLSLPFQSNDDEDVVALSAIRNEKLALLRVDYIDSSSVMKIWVTNTESEEAKEYLSWSIFLVVDLDKFETYFGGIVRETSFLVDVENKMVVYCIEADEDKYTTRVYIVGEDIYKKVYRGFEEESEFHGNLPLLVSYVPSLVQIPTSQSNSLGKRKR